MSKEQPIRLAATAVLLRESSGELEVLLLRRHQQLKVGGGHWVFPGGTVDPEDLSDAGGDQLQALRIAAVRETREEAAIDLAADELQLISYWTTPAHMGRRFETAFFLTSGQDLEVCVDGEEMDDHLWGRPADLVSAHQRGELALMPPTLVTLSELSQCDSIAAAQAFYRAREVPDIHPALTDDGGLVCMLYAGDAGYHCQDPKAPGARNRCYLEKGCWRYEFLAS